MILLTKRVLIKGRTSFLPNTEIVVPSAPTATLLTTAKNANNTMTQAFTLPAGLADGKRMFAMACARSYRDSTYSLPGWTQVDLIGDEGSINLGGTMALFERISDDDAEASYTVTISATFTPTRIGIIVLQIDGADAAAPTIAKHGDATSRDHVVHPGLTAGADNSLVIRYGGARTHEVTNDQPLEGTPTGFTLEDDDNVSSGWQYYWGQSVESAGSVSERTRSRNGGSNRSIGMTVAFAPA